MQIFFSYPKPFFKNGFFFAKDKKIGFFFLQKTEKPPRVSPRRNYDKILVLLRNFLQGEHLGKTSQMADQAYIDFLEKLSSSNWPIVAIYIGGFIGSFIGSLIARRAMKKHFKRIGLV
jgi:hypothetical protein